MLHDSFPRFLQSDKHSQQQQQQRKQQQLTWVDSSGMAPRKAAMFDSTAPRNAGHARTVLMRASNADARTAPSTCAVYLQAAAACIPHGTACNRI